MHRGVGVAASNLDLQVHHGRPRWVEASSDVVSTLPMPSPRDVFSPYTSAAAAADDDDDEY